MTSRFDWRRATGRRRVERIILGIFILASVIVLITSQSKLNSTSPAAQESPFVIAQASAMPDQGWAPLTVFFSAYGSHSEGADITRIEWDLDGDGAFDFDATSQGGYANYLYSKQGQYLIHLRVTDSLGRFATDEIPVDVRLRTSSNVDYWTIFDQASVGRIDIKLTKAAWDQMWIDPIRKVQVKADAVILGDHLEEVGLSMRGQFSLLHSGDKKPWKIDTDAYVDNQEFRNLRQLLLLNSIGDPTLLYEKLAYEMMEFAGVSASHASYVEAWFDFSDDSQPPIFWGVYLMVERVDNKYIGNRFGQESVGGNLYKASHAQRGPMDLIYYGEHIEDYPIQNNQYAYGKMNNEEEMDYRDIIELCRVVDGMTFTSDEEFMQTLEGVLNVDDFLRYTAVVTILDNRDSYTYTGNNYYLFNNPISERFEWIPWDLTWGGGIRVPLFGLPGLGLLERAPLYDNVFKVEEYRNQYTAYVDLLLRYWFTVENITSKAQTYYRMIAPYITQFSGDKAFYGEQSMWSPSDFKDSWRGLVFFTRERSSFLETELQELQP